MKKFNLPRLLAFSFLIAIFAWLLSLHITEPFWNHHEFNGVFYGTIANNYLDLGFIATIGAQITNYQPVDFGSWNLHTHHPATYPLLLAAWMKIFGTSEAVARSLSVVASLVALSVVFWMSKVRWPISFGAILVVATTPLFLYYAKIPVFEPLLLPLALVGLYAYQTKLTTFLEYALLGISVFLAFLVDWPGFWLGFWLIIFEVATTRRLKVLATLATAIGLAGVLILLHQRVTTGSFLAEFMAIGNQRLTAQPFSLYEWTRLLLSRTKAFIGLPVLLLSTFGYLMSYRQNDATKKIMTLALLIGISHIVVFRNITWYHDYMLYHLLPFWFLSTIAAMEIIRRRYKLSSALLVAAVTIGISFWTTRTFLVDLEEMNPHAVCIQFVEATSETLTEPIFKGTLEETRSCPPFIGYYLKRSFGVEVIEK